MEWLDGVKIYFLSSSTQGPPYELWVQSALTILAAFLGALLAYFFQERLERKQTLRHRNSLAVSSMAKILKARSLMKGVKSSFFGNIRDDTPTSEYWKLVLPSVTFSDGLSPLSDEEFEFLLGTDDESDLATKVTFLLDFSRVNVQALHEYSALRRDLSRELDVYTRIVDQEQQSIAYEFAPAENPGLYRRVLEISELCAQLYKNISEAIEISETVAVLSNVEIPKKFRPGTFKKRIEPTAPAPADD
tara:strand:- start:310 stop:1050 length:741 start_codon:yes stop_codon:yes gene_type:complete